MSYNLFFYLLSLATLLSAVLNQSWTQTSLFIASMACFIANLFLESKKLDAQQSKDLQRLTASIKELDLELSAIRATVAAIENSQKNLQSSFKENEKLSEEMKRLISTTSMATAFRPSVKPSIKT